MPGTILFSDILCWCHLIECFHPWVRNSFVLTQPSNLASRQSLQLLAWVCVKRGNLVSSVPFIILVFDLGSEGSSVNRWSHQPLFWTTNCSRHGGEIPFSPQSWARPQACACKVLPLAPQTSPEKARAGACKSSRSWGIYYMGSVLSAKQAPAHSVSPQILWGRYLFFLMVKYR